ncbi:plasmid mobilization relaxase MbeA, partial [Escherichia coli]|uniref:plasmid mobilization relaxase MbeA n=1 Tax=Escherichia coli TaxID=562 RepID=UPI00390824DA
MIVKFHARGKGGGSGPVDYLLGRERNREGATVLQGNPEEVRELIDATPFAKKYTSGVLSFAEKELPPGGREKVMASFERVLMPGLEKNQYSILWVEHQDKGRLELNFVIPNMELQTGKRLQPYYDRADRPRIDAWQTLVNHHYGLHDPNAPENRRTLTLPDNLPETKQALAESVTRGLEVLYHSGEIKGRQDVIQALTEVGLEVVRVTRSSISIADPNGGRNIRLKGAFYEQSFTDGRGVREKAERESRIYRENAERRIQQARRICQRGCDLKRDENQRRYSPVYGLDGGIAEKTPGRGERGDDAAPEGHVKAGREFGHEVAGDSLSPVYREWRDALVSRREDTDEPGRNQGTGRDIAETEREDMGC